MLSHSTQLFGYPKFYPMKSDAKLAIIDVEYTSWEGAMQRNWSGANEHREAVQIYICGLSEDFEVVWNKEYFTRPILNPLLSNYFTLLTGITQERVDALGVSLQSILLSLQELTSYGPIFSWGDGDEGSLRDSCKIQELEYDAFLPSIHDIRPIFQHCGIDTSKYQSGTLFKAVGLSMNGKQHDSQHDVKSMIESLRVLNRDQNLARWLFEVCI